MSSKFLRNSIFGALAGTFSAVGGFICNILIARLLGVGGTGTVTYILWAAGVIATILGLGFPATLARILPELNAKGAFRESAGVLIAFGRRLIFVSLGLAILALLPLNGGIAPWFERGLSWASGSLAEFWPMIAALSILQLFNNFFTGYMRGAQKFEKLTLANGCSSLIQILAIVVGSLSIGVWGAILGYMVGLLIPLVWTLTIFRQTTGSISPEIWRRASSYARTIWAVGLIDTLVWARIEIFFLEASWGSREVGLFSAGLTISALATQAPLLITSGILPHLSERFGMSDWAAMRRAYVSMTRIMAFLLFPACLGTAAITPMLLPLLFGNDFRSAIPPTIILTSVAAFGATASVASNVINAMERNRAILLIGIGGALLSVLAGLTIIPKFGVLGAAAARAVVQTLMVGAGTWYVSARLDCPPPMASLGRLFAAATCCALVAWSILAIAPHAWSLLIAVSGGALTYFFMVWALDALTGEDWTRLPWFRTRVS